MMPDIVLITVESWRYDHRDAISLPSGFEYHRGITAGHYTRPSLSGLLGGTYADAIRTRPQRPTIAERFVEAGYTTIGVCYSPQTALGMGFAKGFHEFEAIDGYDSRISRGSQWRERLATIGFVRSLHRRLAPKGATLEAVPSDDHALSVAQERFETVEPPRFLWLHLMDSHRPYGRDGEGIARNLDAKAAAARPAWTQRSLTAGEQETITDAYRSGLERAGEAIRPFLSTLANDTMVVIAGDHGEELGEEGYWFHGGYRQRVVVPIISVPVAVRNLGICGEPVSLMDIGPTLLRAGGGCVDGFDGIDRQWHPRSTALTVAPWAGDVTARLSGPSENVTLANAQLSHEFADRSQMSPALEGQLEALGYVSAGN